MVIPQATSLALQELKPSYQPYCQAGEPGWGLLSGHRLRHQAELLWWSGAICPQAIQDSEKGAHSARSWRGRALHQVSVSPLAHSGKLSPGTRRTSRSPPETQAYLLCHTGKNELGGPCCQQGPNYLFLPPSLLHLNKDAQSADSVTSLRG